MRRFFESGWGFMLVAVLCFTAAVASQNGALFISLGGFWILMAIVVRSKRATKKTEKSKNEPS